MKKQFLIFMLLLVTYTTAYAEFVEQFRSEPKRRFAKTLKNVLASDEYSTRDLNSNGVDDRFSFEINGQSGGYLLLAFDGLSNSPFWLLDLTETLGFTSAEGLSMSFELFYCKGEATPNLFILQDGNCEEGEFQDFWIMNPSNDAIEYSAKCVKFLGVASIDNDLVPEIFFYDSNTREIVVIEWKEGGNTNNSIASIEENERRLPAQLNKSNLDYTLTLKYESAPKTELVYDDSFFESVNDLDADGDGVMDIVLALENQNDVPAAIAVLDGETKNLKWAFQYPEGQLSEFSEFHGFFDIDANGVKEALFGKRTIVTADKNVYSLGENFEYRAVYDVDNDSYPDFIGIGLQDSTVQVWGIESPSGIGQKDLIAAGFQLKQNYPNPFNPNTKISWQLPTSERVVLKVFDILGTEVAALVDEYKPAGNYEVEFDAAKLSSGVYFYSLSYGTNVKTKKMSLLK